VEKISLPRERFLSLFGGDLTKSCYRLGSPDFIPPNMPDLVFWAFPLDEEEPWQSVLLLGADDSSGFNPAGMERMLEDIRDLLRPGKNGGEGGKTEGENPGAGDALGGLSRDRIEQDLLRFYSGSPSSAGLVLEVPARASQGEDSLFQQRLFGMVALCGTAVALAPRRGLVLLPTGMDRELVAHRLEKSLAAKTLLVFEADSPGKALSAIKPYLP
jgi:hypothetical protein